MGEDSGIGLELGLEALPPFQGVRMVSDPNIFASTPTRRQVEFDWLVDPVAPPFLSLWLQKWTERGGMELRR